MIVTKAIITKEDVALTEVRNSYGEQVFDTLISEGIQGLKASDRATLEGLANSRSEDYDDWLKQAQAKYGDGAMRVFYKFLDLDVKA